MDSLNKKLALFAGLHPYPHCECLNGRPGPCWGESAETYGKHGHWHFGLPDFTGSLDACFDHIVPKLLPKIIQLENYSIDGSYGVSIIDEKIEQGGIWIGLSPNPALAFCLAVEKLIEQG